jgi:PAS domain S-box-containing protein
MTLWYIIPALIGFSITLIVWTAVRLVYWERAPQNIAGAVMLLAIGCNLLGYLYQLVNHDLQVMLGWEKVQVIGLNLVYPAWLIFSLYFTGNSKRVTPLLLVLLSMISAIPVIAFLIPATSIWFVQVEGTTSIGMLNVLQQKIGPIVWVTSLLAQVEGLIGAYLLFQKLPQVRKNYRQFVTLLFLSHIFTYAGLWMDLTGFNPIAPISIFNLAFVPTSIAVSWSIYALRVGQTLSLMRVKVLDTMHDGVVVLDGQDKVAYLNPAARHVFLLQPQQAVPVNLEQLAPEIADRLSVWKQHGAATGTVVLRDMVYSSRLSIIEDWKGDIVGQVIVLRNVTDRERMEQALEAHALELARTNSFAQSIALLSARVAASADLNQVYDTLKDELRRLELDFCVALRVAGEPGHILQYISLSAPAIQLVDKLIGSSLIGLRLPELGEPDIPDAIRQDGAIFVPKLMNVLQLIFKKYPFNFEQILSTATGTSLQMASLSFRLVAQDEDMGILAIWGPSLRIEDVSPLSTFAAQVSAAIQKTRLIQNEQDRVTELEKTNRIILSLTKVSAGFEANLNADQIMALLGEELRKLDITCVLALIDPATNILYGRYTSIPRKDWQSIAKFSNVTLSTFQIPYQEWQALFDNSASPVYIIQDPVSYTHAILKIVPRRIIKKGLDVFGIKPETPAVWLPLRASGRDIGILALWGFRDPEQLQTFFALFGRQVATAIENARLMADLEGLKTFNEEIVQGVAEAIVWVDAKGKILFANQAASKMIGLPKDEIISQDWHGFVNDQDWNKVRKGIAEKVVAVELNLIPPNGRAIPVLANIQPVIKEGKLENTLVSLIDIRQRIETERQIRASMEEKEALLKEIHHRVKNNLQIVSSLLNLQSSQFKDREIVEAFLESQNRVKSMALIHEKLYRSNTLARIRFDDYMSELAHSLLKSLKSPSRYIRLEVDSDPLNLDIDTAIPCGLIINELITNSLKHGFQDMGASECLIHMQLKLLPDNQVRLIVQDNGTGFPPGLDLQNTSSLGLRLVTTLTRQIEGRVYFASQPGARVEIVFTSPEAYLDQA